MEKGDKGGPTNRAGQSGIMGIGQAALDMATIKGRANKGPGSSHAKSPVKKDQSRQRPAHYTKPSFD